MDTRTGEIRELADGEKAREHEVLLSDVEAERLRAIPAAERAQAFRAFRTEPQPQVMKERKPTTKKARSQGMPKHRTNGDNPNRGKKKGRR